MTLFTLFIHLLKNIEMKTITFFRKVGLLLVTVIACSTVHAQEYEVTFGENFEGGSEEIVDVKPLRHGNSIVLATRIYPSVPKKILLTKRDTAGREIWVRVIDQVSLFTEFEASSLELAFDPADPDNLAGYFITGTRNNLGDTRMIMLRTDTAGDLIWAKMMNNSPISSFQQHRGVSLERQPNGDVIAVGKSTNRSNNHEEFTATRFNFGGTPLWSYRYSSPEDLDFYPAESCNGKLKNRGVMAVVGQVVGDFQEYHTFLSCINVINGVELWRNWYDSEYPEDAGTGVTWSPVTGNFQVAGRVNDGAGRMIWVFNANPKKGALKESVIYSSQDHNIVANDICVGTNDTTTVVAGWLDDHGINKTFAMNLPLLPGFPIWSYYYNATESPGYDSDVTINRIKGIHNAYLIGTSAFDAFFSVPDYHMHLLRVNKNGLHPQVIGCDEISFSLDTTEQGIFHDLNKIRKKVDWVPLSMRSWEYDLSLNECPRMKSIISVEISQSQPHEFPSDIRLTAFPNPIFGGDIVNLQVELTESTEVEIQLMDLTSRQLGSWRESREAGLQTFRLKIPEALFTNVYVVRVILATGEQQSIKLIVF